MDKSELRKHFKTKRAQMLKSGQIDEISKSIVANIISSDLFNNSVNIGIFYPLSGEVDLLDILKYKDKNFYFPKCIENNMGFAKYCGKFNTGAFSIPEPDSELINPDILDLIYIPALCCNTKCYRLGYGKGFYDRFFKEYNIHAKKIIVLPQSFISNDFIEDDFDYRCDSILCESTKNL